MSEMADDFKAMRDHTQKENNDRRQAALNDLTDLCTEHVLDLKILKPWHLRLERFGKTIDIFPTSMKYHIIKSDIRGKYRHLVPFLKSFFDLNTETELQDPDNDNPDFEGFATFNEWQAIRDKADPTPECTQIGTLMIQRFMIMTTPLNQSAMYVQDLGTGAIGQVWFYKSTKEMIQDRNNIFEDDYLDHCTEQVPGFTITIEILGTITKIDSDIVKRLWWNGAREICREMALWFALNVADPQRDGRYKRYKFI